MALNKRQLWLALLVVLVLAAYIVGVAVLVPLNFGKPTDTGDPLYDKYIAWIMNDYEYNFNLDKPDEDSTGLSNVVGDIDPFGKWETEFGDDPRYWLLRYRYSKRDSDVKGESAIYDIAYLEHAREAGVIDGTGLFVLLEKSDDEIWSQYKPDHDSWRVPLEQRVIDEKLQRSKVDEAIGAEHDQLLAELLEAAGDESLPHYYAAMFDSQRGDYAAALAHLIDGNRAPNNTNMIGFPFNVHLASLGSDLSMADKLASGSIFMDELGTSVPYAIQLRSMLKAMAADASKRDDRAVLDELHTFACRSGYKRGIHTRFALMGNVMVQIVANTFIEERGSSLSAEELESMNNLLDLKEQTKVQTKVSMENDTMLHPWGTTPLQKSIWHVKAKMTRGRSAFRSLNECIHNDFSSEIANNFGPVKELFLQMEAFDYSTLKFE